MLKKLFSLKSDVKELLEAIEATRDSDRLLVSVYYSIKLGAKLEKMKASDLLIAIRDGLLPFPDHITRVRRKLQETYPELRGKSHAKRLELEAEVRENIRDL